MNEESRFQGDDFKGYLQELVINQNFASDKEEGIAKLVLDKGYDILSEKQKYVFDKSMELNLQNDCQYCRLEVPWSEMSAAMFNGGYCSWCWKVVFDNRV